MIKFQDITGYDGIKEHMKQAVSKEKVSHAYIIEGEEGSGKKIIASAFAALLQCENHTNELEPCGNCKSCVQAENESQPDIIVFQSEKPLTIGVDEIREQIVEDIQIKPYQSRYKIYIVPDADTMTQQAQNALLKTIEEPPEYGIILLLANNSGRFLPTILSRCVKLTLHPLDNEKVRDYLKNHFTISDKDLDFCVHFAWGNIGKGIRLASSEHFQEIKETVIRMLSYIHEMEDYEVIDYIKYLSKFKLEIDDCIGLMMMWYRDVLLLKVTKDPNRLVFKEQYSIIKKQGELSSYEGIETILKAMETAKVRLRAKVGIDITLELLLYTIKEN